MADEVLFVETGFDDGRWFSEDDDYDDPDFVESPSVFASKRNPADEFDRTPPRRRKNEHPMDRKMKRE